MSGLDWERARGRGRRSERPIGTTTAKQSRYFSAKQAQLRRRALARQREIEAQRARGRSTEGNDQGR
jgi:hypothetical protein